MAELTSETTFTVQAATEVYEEVADLVLLPENAGVNALRELRYPDDVLPPLIYEDHPDLTENFDSGPLTARPMLKADMALADTVLTRWSGYVKDRPVKEVWKGGGDKSRMSAYFLRRLWEYFANPPASGYITWTPKDRLDQAYNIEIESLTAGGADTIALDGLPLRQGFIMGEVIFIFRIVGEA